MYIYIYLVIINFVGGALVIINFNNEIFFSIID